MTFWRIRFFLILSVLCLLAQTITLSSLAQLPSSPFLFDEGFEDGRIPATLRYSQGWEVVSKDLFGLKDRHILHTNSQKLEFLLIPAGIEWTDYRVEVWLWVGEHPFLFTLTRFDFTGDPDCLYGYMLVVSDSLRGSLSANSPTSCYGENDPLETEFDIPVETWFKLQLDTIGDTMTVSINGAVVALMDAMVSEKGTFGLYALEETEIQIDHIRVTELHEK